jgi:hypothetical protein
MSWIYPENVDYETGSPFRYKKGRFRVYFERLEK